MRSLITPLFLVLCLAFQGFASAQNTYNKSHKKCRDKNNNWTDILRNDCDWYGQYPNIRCMWSGTLKGNTLGASSICCACGGGFRPTPSPTSSPTSSPTPLPTPSPTNLKIEEPSVAYHVYSDIAGKYIGFQNNQITLFDFKNRFTKIALVPDSSVLEGVRLKFMDPVSDTYLSMDYDGSIGTSKNKGSSVFTHTSIFINGENISTFMTKALGRQFYLAVNAKKQVSTVQSEDNARAKFSVEKDTNIGIPSPTPGTNTISYIKSNIINKYIGYESGKVMLLSAKSFFTQIIIEQVQDTNRAVDRVRLRFVNPKVATYIMLGNNGVITTTTRPESFASSVFVQMSLSGKSVFRGVSKGVHYFLEVRNGSLTTSKTQGNGALFMVEDSNQIPITPTEPVISYIRAKDFKKFIGFRNGQVMFLNAKNAFTKVIIEEVTDSRAVDKVLIKFVNPRAATYLRLGNNGLITTTLNPNTPTAEFVQTTFNGVSTFRGISSNGINYFLEGSRFGNLSTSRTQTNNALFRVYTVSHFDGKYYIKYQKTGGYVSFFQAEPGVTSFSEKEEQVEITPVGDYYAIKSLHNGKYLSVKNGSVVSSNTRGSTELFEFVKQAGKESMTIMNVESGRYLLGPFYASSSNYDVLETTINESFARAKFALEKIF